MMSLNQDKLERFQKRFVEDIGAMMLCHMCCIGQRLDLFQYMSQEEFFTSESLALRADCNERYIREWLCTMTCAGWVEYDQKQQRFHFPPEHQHILVNTNQSSYHGGALEAAHAFASVAPKMIGPFREGGGLTMEQISPEIGLVVEQMTRPSQLHLIPSLIEQYFPDVHQNLVAGIKVADVGCGTGNSLVSLSSKYPNSQFWGFEPDERSVQRAYQNFQVLQDKGIAIPTIIQGTSALMENEFFDLVMTWDVVHDLSDPEGFLRDVHRALKPKGIYIMNEVSASSDLASNLVRERTFIYSLSTMYCLTLSLAGGGPGYGACMGEKIPQELCSQVGFSSFFQIDSPARLYRIEK